MNVLGEGLVIVEPRKESENLVQDEFMQLLAHENLMDPNIGHQRLTHM